MRRLELEYKIVFLLFIVWSFLKKNINVIWVTTPDKKKAVRGLKINKWPGSVNMF